MNDNTCLHNSETVILQLCCKNGVFEIQSLFIAFLLCYIYWTIDEKHFTHLFYSIRLTVFTIKASQHENDFPSRYRS